MPALPNYYNPYYQVQPNTYQTPMNTNAPQQMQIQNNGFVSAPNEEFARSYPVAIGNSVMFKDETAPYIYTKTMGFSQMDAPRFEKYRLVKEDATERSNSPQNEQIDIESIILSINKANDEIEALWAEIDAIKNTKPKNVGRVGCSKRDKNGDDGDDE